MRPKPNPARDHREDPIIALAAIANLATLEAVLSPDRPDLADELTVDAVEVFLTAKVRRAIFAFSASGWFEATTIANCSRNSGM